MPQGQPDEAPAQPAASPVDDNSAAVIAQILLAVIVPLVGFGFYVYSRAAAAAAKLAAMTPEEKAAKRVRALREVQLVMLIRSFSRELQPALRQDRGVAYCRCRPTWPWRGAALHSPRVMISRMRWG